MHTSYNIWSRKAGERKLGPREKDRPCRGRTTRRCESIAGMDSLPLPDLYLIDSRKLLKEVHRIRQLALAIPPSVEAHSAQQTVLDALWRARERHAGNSQGAGTDTQRVRRQGEGADRSFAARSGRSKGHIVGSGHSSPTRNPTGAAPAGRIRRRPPRTSESSP